MDRISREQMLMEVAHVVAKRATCSRAQVGVVFARDGRILATGYNGAPPGMAHCVHESYVIPAAGFASLNAPAWAARERGSWVPEATLHWDGSTVSFSPACTVVEHAERNAIAYAAREGIRLGESDAYCTHAPCLDCARALVSVGIRSLTYEIPYRLTQGVELLAAQGIDVIDLSDSEW